MSRTGSKRPLSLVGSRASRPAAIAFSIALPVLLLSPAGMRLAQAQLVQAQPPAGEAPAAGKPAQAPAPGETLTPPVVVDPKPVETQPVAPPPPEDFTGTELQLTPVPVLAKKGSAGWDQGFAKIVSTVKELEAEAERLGLKKSGDIFIAYTASDDLGFEFEAQVPFSGTTTDKPKEGMTLGASHAGKVMRFTHKGSFDDMDGTYEQIANFLDSKNIESEDLYIEQYRTDPATSAPDGLTIDILVPLR